jgi:hypothetical protein
LKWDKTYTILFTRYEGHGSIFFNKYMEGLVCFANAGYLSGPHNGRLSQTGCVFMCGGASIHGIQ